MSVPLSARRFELRFAQYSASVLLGVGSANAQIWVFDSAPVQEGSASPPTTGGKPPLILLTPDIGTSETFETTLRTMTFRELHQLAHLPDRLRWEMRKLAHFSQPTEKRLRFPVMQSLSS